MKTVMKNNRQQIGEADKLINLRPLFFVAVFLCFGIVFAYFRLRYGISALWSLAILPVLLIPLLFLSGNSGKKAIALSGILMLAFLIGQIGFIFQLDRYTSAKNYQNTPTTVVGIVQQRNEYEEYTKLVLEEVLIGGNKEKGKLIAYLPVAFVENIEISDKIYLQGKVTTKPLDFEKTWDIVKDIRFEVEEVEEVEKLGREFRLFSSITRRMYDRIYAGMDKTSAATTVALLIGDMSDIEEGLLDNIRYGGIAHVFSVSGMNVGALYGFCLFLINGKLKRLNKPLRFLFVFFVIFVYTGICGFSASVTRASVVCLFAYANRLFGTKTDFLESLGLSAIVILLFSPASLFDLGFQLSFAACMGLVLLSEPIAKPLARVGTKIVGTPDIDTPLTIPQRIMRACVSFVSACIAAQIATSPIQLNAFGYLSGWSLLLNCIFVPLISAMFFVMLSVVFCACVLPALFAPILLYAPSILWSLLLITFETLDFSTLALTNVIMPNVGTVCYYGGMQFLSDKWNFSKRQSNILSITCFCVCGMVLLVANL